MASWLSRIFSRPQQQQKSIYDELANYSTSFLQSPGKPVWMKRNYVKFAQEAYVQNVIAYRSIELVARSVASVKVDLFEHSNEGKKRLLDHPAKRIMLHPNPQHSGSHLTHASIAYQLIAGNAYVHAVGPQGEAPQELHLLRPDRVSVIAGEGGVAKGYQYKVGDKVTVYPVDRITGQSRILHFKRFHPLDDWYGLSSVDPAAYSIDQHNQAGAWNQSLMQNGARPSGALIVNTQEHGGHLTEDQYYRIKQQVDEQFSGFDNAGRPLLLEGGLEWKEMSLRPKDMDFIETKHSSARDIALAFGVPPQLLGIPGDNTYSNLAEARLALWEQTVIPALNEWIDALNHWLLPMYGNNLQLEAQLDAVPALSPRREELWQRMKDADFLSDDEKREKLGF